MHISSPYKLASLLAPELAAWRGSACAPATNSNCVALSSGCFVVILSPKHNTFSRRSPIAPKLNEAMMVRPRPEDFLPHDSTQRTEFNSSYCQTTAYPSGGGLVIGLFTAVELRYLGLSNLKPANRSQDQSEEDSLALRMMGLGSHWWPRWNVYARHKVRIGDLDLYHFHFPPRVNVGYPSSGEGVWVFKFSEDQQTWEEEDARKPYLPRMPDCWDTRIHMALTMGERCELLKEFGATCYEDKDACEDLPSSLEEGIQRGERYKVLLDRMDDLHYVDKWLCGDGETT